MYTYYAKILKIIDGSTLELLINLGMNLWMKQRIHMSDIITACLESHNEREQLEARRAKEFLENAAALALRKKTTLLEHLEQPDVIIKTKKEKHFVHFIAEVALVGDDCTLGDKLKKAGLGKKEFYGG